jgi:hypothetical protein
MKKHSLYLFSILLFAQCEQKKNTITMPSSASILDSVFSDKAAESPIPIHIARSKAKPNQEITVSGMVMGSDEPFVEGRAAFLLGDPEKLTPCNTIPSDTCSTPWDNCCDTPESKKIGIATIQVIGVDGRVFKESIKSKKGLTHLSKIIVKGKVAEISTEESLVINAESIYIQQ